MAEQGAGAAPARAASAAGRVLALLVGLASTLVAAWLALHHPLSPALALGGVALLAAAQAAWPPLWLIALPALLPWLGLGAWTGWLVAEEMDLAILAVAAGAYLRWAVLPDQRLRAGQQSRRVRAWGRALLLLWTASVLLAMQRGAMDAGGWTWGWWQGLREPLNALRLAKPTLAVLLLLPLWWRLQQRPGQRCTDQLSWGMAAMLAGITLWCVYERAAFPGLLNMATDYRSTGPFWETQVGGASLDISLALTLPFALRLAWTARQPLAAAVAWTVVLGGVYAGLTTFSRIVYLALPVGALLLWLTQRRQQAAQATADGHRHMRRAGAASDAAPGSVAMVSLPAAATLALLAAGLGVWLFPTAGYRGLLALLGNLVLLLWLVPRSTGRPVAAWVGAWGGGLALATLSAGVALAWPKGAYLAYAATWLAAAAALLAGGGRPATWSVAGAAFVGQLAGTVLVALTWGGQAALPAAAMTAGMVALAWALAAARRPAPWPGGPATVVQGGAALAAVLAVVAVFGAGPFMSDRLQHTEADSAERWAHWREGLALNQGGMALWLGEGLGRFPDLYLMRARLDARPGDIRLMPTGTAAGAGTGARMRLVGGNHVLGKGELLRLSQRVSGVPATGLQLAVQVRSESPVQLVAQLCSKHLLYEGSCRETLLSAEGGQQGWQTLRQPLPDDLAVDDGLPRFTVLSLASQTRRPVEVRSVQLTDASGRQWLHNPDFADGGARWFITSDRIHLPWHAKNMVVHLVVEQGLLGLAALLLATIAALVAVWSRLRAHPMAPALGAAIVGVWVVGAVDSVLDMPRVATWLLLVTGMALQLHQPSRRATGRPPGPAPAAGLTADGAARRPAGDPARVAPEPPAHAAPRQRRRLAWLLGLPLAALLALGASLAAGLQAGRTPAELLAHASKRLDNTPLLDQTAGPLLGSLAHAFEVQAAGGQLEPYAVPALPPNPAGRDDLATQPPGADRGREPVDSLQLPGGRRLLVGPTRAIRSVSAAAAQARDGDTVEIDPGDYIADVAVWTQDRLVIRGMGPRVRLIARGASAEGKAIWVLRGGRITVEGIDFIGARVDDRNGAGIRFERGHLVVRRCLFFDNENGILASPNAASVLEVEASEFGYNGAGDGQTHHLYANRIGQLTVTGSWFHHANVGHLIKSRALRSLIAYNRLADGAGGRASYELEFPNGGTAVVLGNLIQQGPQTSNSAIVSYGAEGLHARTGNRLQMAFNTVVNAHPHGGTFVRAVPDTELVLLMDNLWVGRGVLDVPADAVQQRNRRLPLSDLAQVDMQDWRLPPAVLAQLPTTPLSEIDASLVPQQEYRHPAGLRPLSGDRRVPGAQQPAP